MHGCEYLRAGPDRFYVVQFVRRRPPRMQEDALPRQTSGRRLDDAMKINFSVRPPSGRECAAPTTHRTRPRARMPSICREHTQWT
jgi:hypothetical protein